MILFSISKLEGKLHKRKITMDKRRLKKKRFQAIFSFEYKMGQKEVETTRDNNNINSNDLN
ncbi:hypothetical protein DICVIV_09295 [Dictyocaulus viviparus]|uniref:Uncharacterized protein n=1 Tax=Dictyocaulus viviparus TaxID=29172 RepID=A0A0D8XJG2_DICVI|nr:hypothetical protein DICVIV_09295 [Dictyocaulus viviparus]